MIRLRQGALIVAEGDSLTYGYDEVQGDYGRPLNAIPFKRSSSPYPETLAVKLGPGVTVLNQGVPGDRTYEGVLRWQWAPAGDLTIIMYGTNDCFDRSPTMMLTSDTYGRLMEVLIGRRRDAGAQVLVLPPAPVFDISNECRLEIYRDVARKVARSCGVMSTEIADAIRSVPDPFTDGVHLSAAANAALAEHIAGLVEIV